MTKGKLRLTHQEVELSMKQVIFQGVLTLISTAVLQEEKTEVILLQTIHQ